MDADILVCVKPARVLSTDEPGGLPELLREALGGATGRQSCQAEWLVKLP